MAWRTGDPAPTTLYRTATGALAEAVVLDDPHELIVEAGDTLDADQAADGRRFTAEAEAARAAVEAADTA